MAPNKKWSERETVKFVELYEAEEVLWNVRLKDYKNKDARNAAIQHIIHNLNIAELTTQEVNIKINNIRSTYSQEKAKIGKSKGTGSSVDNIYVPSLAWFEVADRFLDGIIKSRKRFQNVVDSNECNSSGNSQNISECSSDIPTRPSSDIPANPSPDIPANPSPDTPAIPSTTDNAQFAAPSSRKKMKITLAGHITKSIETPEAIKNQALNSKEKEDEFDHFGKNIASQLRQLPLLDALDVPSDILNLIKIKRQSILRRQTESSCNESDYYIEIPDHMFMPLQNITNQDVTSATETHKENEGKENKAQEENNTLLEQAITSIDGITQEPEQ